MPVRQRPDPPFYWQFVEPVWDAVSIDDGPDVFLEQFQAIRPEVGHLLAAHWCQSEVRNGGFYQFFENSTGVLAPEAARAFAAIGLQDWSDLVTEAMKFFGEPYPRDEEQRVPKLPEFGDGKREDFDPFFALDNRFYESLKADRQRFQKAADEYARSVGL
jgi:hypothetical protein